MTEIYYMRHGETTANVDRICAGHTDVNLTENGINQAREAGKDVTTKGLTFDLIVSSPLKRALDSAVLVAEGAGYPSGAILVDDIFIERYRGSLEGKPLSLQYGMTNDEYIQKGAESEEGLRSRAELAIKRLAEKGLDRILVVGHNSFGKYFIAAVNGGNPKEIKKLPNAQIFKIGVN